METDVRKYLDLKVDELKLKTIDGLSIGVGKILSLMTVLMLAAIVLAAFSFGTVLLLGEALGSWAAASFIIGGVVLLLMLGVLLVWKKLFVNVFVKLFINIFYGNE